ncbi:MAG TPA: hypothetical protein VFX59_03090, partial [Polyangiales bacterium]|nr:hypothetical protein [Polyangiales bacterium]
MRFLFAWLALLPLIARAQESYHDVVFEPATGAVLLREHERLRHIAADDTVQDLPPYPRPNARLDLLILADGLWVRDGLYFAFFRPGPAGWSSGTWLVSRAFRARALERVSVRTDEASPVLSGPQGTFHLRLQATETAIVEHEAKGYEPRYPGPLGVVGFDASLRRCVVKSSAGMV